MSDTILPEDCWSNGEPVVSPFWLLGRSDFSPQEKIDYLDRGWVDSTEFIDLVTEIIIGQCDKECKYDRPMWDADGETHFSQWYLSRTGVIDKLLGLVEQRDHLVKTLANMRKSVTQLKEDIEDYEMV